MPVVTPCALPAGALLQRYARDGGFVDGYATLVAGNVALATFVEAFYTTPLFRIERLILRTLARRPSTDGDVRALARADSASFAAWTVEERTHDQLLLRDFTGRTRSWLMTMPATTGPGTRLIFGSAVVPARGGEGAPRMGVTFTALMGFHRLYSRLLLAAAARRIGASTAAPPRT